MAAAAAILSAQSPQSATTARSGDSVDSGSEEEDGSGSRTKDKGSPAGSHASGSARAAEGAADDVFATLGRAGTHSRRRSMVEIKDSEQVRTWTVPRGVCMRVELRRETDAYPVQVVCEPRVKVRGSMS